MDIATPGNGHELGTTVVGGWPILDPSNYVTAMPTYTHALAQKLVNADADVAAAVNAAQQATAAAAVIGATTTVTLSADTNIGTTEADLGNLTRTITVTGPEEKWAIDVHLDYWQGGAAATGVILVIVDGVAQPRQLVVSTAATARLPLHGRYHITGMSAGNHTIKIRARNLTGSAVATTHSYLTLERIR